MSLLPFQYVQNIGECYDFDKIFDFIGSGSFATVYAARRRVAGSGMNGGMEVALKVISKRELSSEKALKDILNEVEILKRLNHENCVKLYEVLQTDSEVVLVLELVKDGGELFQVVTSNSRQGVIDERTSSRIMKQLVSAVSFLHSELKVVHRDLKPENILISPKSDIDSPSMKITIVDFGLAKYFGSTRRMIVVPPAPPPPVSSYPLSLQLPSGWDENSRALRSSMSSESVDTQSSHTNSPIITTPCGTIKYAAPETVRGLLENGSVPRETVKGFLPKLDVYSIGIIAFVMLSGQLPFVGKNKASLATQMEQGVSFTGPRWEDVSEEAKDFVSLLLEPDPGNRVRAADALSHRWLSPFDRPRLPHSNSHYDDIISSREDLNSIFNAMMPQSSSSELGGGPPRPTIGGRCHNISWTQQQQNNVSKYFPIDVPPQPRKPVSQPR